MTCRYKLCIGKSGILTQDLLKLLQRCFTLALRREFQLETESPHGAEAHRFGQL